MTEQEKKQETSKGNSLSDKVVDKIEERMSQKKGKNKKKEMKPMKAKLSKGKKRKGYVVVVKIHENHQIDFEKVPIEESAYKLREDTYHSLASSNDVFFYKGKHPMVLQPTTKKNPYNPLEGENETKGQKHIMNLMSKHSIQEKKKKAGSILLYIALAIGAYFLITKVIGV